MESNEDLVISYLRNTEFHNMCYQLKCYVTNKMDNITPKESAALNFIYREYFRVIDYTYDDFIKAINEAKDAHSRHLKD